MARFKNPANGYEVSPGVGDFFGTFFLGAIYLAVKGLWLHVAISIVACVALVLFFGMPGLFLAFVVWVGYAFATPGLVADKCKRDGWVEIPDGVRSYSEEAEQIAQRNVDKVCPDCAETVKGAAKKCRYCGHEFAPQ